MARLGFGVWPGMPFNEALEGVRVAEEKGYEAAFVVESSLNPGKDAVSVIGALGPTTKRIKLGTGIINVFTRTATLIASTVATLDEITGGRTILGLGSGHVVIEPYHSVPFAQPAARIREYIPCIRELIAGNRLNFDGRFVKIKNLKLSLEPVRKYVPIYVATVSRTLARLAGEMADGILLVLSSPERAKHLIASAKEGLAKSGRSASNFDFAAYLPTFMMEDYGKSVAAAKRVVASYGASIFYRRLYTGMGFEKEAALLEQAWSKGGLDEAALQVTDSMAKEITVVGSADECLSKVETYRNAGINFPIIQPLHVAGNLKANVLPCLEAFSL